MPPRIASTGPVAPFVILATPSRTIVPGLIVAAEACEPLNPLACVMMSRIEPFSNVSWPVPVKPLALFA